MLLFNLKAKFFLFLFENLKSIVKIIFFSKLKSGTCSRPKGVIQSQFKIINNLYFRTQSSQKTVTCQASQFHHGASVLGFFSVLLNPNICMVYPSIKLDNPEDILVSIEKYKCD